MCERCGGERPVPLPVCKFVCICLFMLACALHAVVRVPTTFFDSLCNTALAPFVLVTLREPASTEHVLQTHSLCNARILPVA